jgi:4-hydroxybenzoate polyprenyltransferase
VGARTAAMGMNRLIDAQIDGANPRTRERAIPAGLLGKKSAGAYIALAIALFFISAAQLNTLCLYLAPVALSLLFFYSYCKRFTAMSHIVLGFCLALAPVGAWIAIREGLDAPAAILGTAVLFWVAGFDILYAMQDLDFDRSAGLYSIPARLGIPWSLRVARLFHLISLSSLGLLYVVTDLGFFYLCGVILAAALMTYEHWLVRHGDLSRLDAAFFTVNGYISITVFIFTLIDILAQ